MEGQKENRERKEDIKKMKTNLTVLVSILMMVVVATAAGAGTMAWFSTEVVAVGDTAFRAGIMSMAGVATDVETPENWKPGDNFTVTFELTNDGTIDIGYLATTFTIDRVGAIGIEYASNIEVTGWWEFIPTDDSGGGAWQDNFGPAQQIGTLVGDFSDPLTLLEMVQSYTADEIAHHNGANDPTSTFSVLDQFGNYVKSDSDYVTGEGYDQLAGEAIIAGGTYKMQLDFQFMASAGNNLQGETLKLSTEFFGFQDYSQRP